jgi:hypothetical protein
VGGRHSRSRNQLTAVPANRTRQRRRRPGDLPDQTIIGRIFVVADYAVVAPDGKLYISGANIQTMWLPEFPGVAGQLFIALLLGVPWSVASEPHHVVIRALDEDRQPLPGTPDPLFDAQAETGRPPGTRPGDELTIALAFGLTGLPIDRERLVFFRVVVDEADVAAYPFRFRQLPSPAATTLGRQPD